MKTKKLINDHVVMADDRGKPDQERFKDGKQKTMHIL